MREAVDFDAIEAIIVGKMTLGTRRQYAEQSKEWRNGDGRTEDQLLQRIWNLADDSLVLLNEIHALLAQGAERRWPGVCGATLSDPGAGCALRTGHDGFHVPLSILWQEAGYVDGPWSAHIGEALIDELDEARRIAYVARDAAEARIAELEQALRRERDWWVGVGTADANWAVTSLDGVRVIARKRVVEIDADLQSGEGGNRG